jgi:hypothetical protein
MFFKTAGPTLAREPHQLKPSNLAQILQYDNGTSPDFLPIIFDVNT